MSPSRLPRVARHPMLAGTLVATTLAAALAAAPASAQVVLATNLDAPTYHLGAVHNQDRWWGPYGYQEVSSAQAHSGTQSLRTMAGDALRGLDTPGAELDIRTSTPWWAQAWLYMPSGQHPTVNAIFQFAGVLYSPYIHLRGDGFLTLTGGAYNATAATFDLGARALDQWLKLEIVHTLGPNDTPSNLITLRVTGRGVDATFETLYGINGMPNALAVTSGSGYSNTHGYAYWDDLQAGYGNVPVPEPGTYALMALGLAAVGWRARRQG